VHLVSFAAPLLPANPKGWRGAGCCTGRVWRSQREPCG
jgi:hypothetical protein